MSPYRKIGKVYPTQNCQAFWFQVYLVKNPTQLSFCQDTTEGLPLIHLNLGLLNLDDALRNKLAGADVLYTYRYLYIVAYIDVSYMIIEEILVRHCFLNKRIISYYLAKEAITNLSKNYPKSVPVLRPVDDPFLSFETAKTLAVKINKI